MTIQQFLVDAGVKVPLICGAMYPCSSPDLVRAVGLAGGLGMIQPMSFTYIHGVALGAAIEQIEGSEGVSFGINIILETGSVKYFQKNMEWLRLALEAGCIFVVTALGKPGAVVELAHQYGAKVYHKVTTIRHAEVAIDAGVDGLIAVNNRAGGHVGGLSAQQLLEAMLVFGVPVIAAGGCGSSQDFVDLLELGYSGVLCGTRFVASQECVADTKWKEAIIAASENDIMETDKITGVPLSVIRTAHLEYLEKTGSSPFIRFLLRNAKTKKWMRMWYSWRSGRSLKRAMQEGFSTKDVYQAGKSVHQIGAIESVEDIVSSFAALAKNRGLF